MATITVIPLGTKVKHRYTPFKGLVTGRAEYLNGCRRVLVCSAELKDKAPLEVWFDEVEMETVKSKPVKKKPRFGGGGPRRADPTRGRDDGGIGHKEE